MDYQKGKIYKIESHVGPKIYIGSTTKQYLSQRMEKHRSKYNSWKRGKCTKTTSFDLFDEYGIENCKIILLELCPCNTKDELTKKEAFYIRSLDCVNKYIPDRTKKEYVIDTKEKKQEYDVKYRENNKEKIKERKTKPFVCECGTKMQWDSKSLHERSKKHLNYLASKVE